VKFSPPSINKNNKSNGEKIVNILLTEVLILTGPRNLELARKITPEKNLKSIIQTRVEIPELDKKIKQPKKKKEYNQKRTKEILQQWNNNIKQENQSNIWILRLRPRTKLTIPGNSTEKYKGKLNSK
jgi:hypothetical protein